VLVTAYDTLRGELEPLLTSAHPDLRGTADRTNLVDPDQAMRHVLFSLARRWLNLHEEIKIHSRQIKAPARRSSRAWWRSSG
jgi:transposase